MKKFMNNPFNFEFMNNPFNFEFMNKPFNLQIYEGIHEKSL